MRLQGKVALVTGAARGIGEAIARRFASEGADVIITDINDSEGEAVASSIGAMAEYQHLDVRIEEDWVRVIDGVIKSLGRLDVLVNNAGVTGFESGVVPHNPESASLDAWRAVHQTNLDGVFLGCKHAIRVMRPAIVGSIINVGSRSGVVGIPGAAAYASSKGAVRNHTKSVALYCAEQGLHIRCNVIQPAAILTPMWEPVLGNGRDRDARMAEFVKDTPLSRFGTPDEVAALAAYLASDESAYATGAEFTLDGGILAGSAARPRTAQNG
jgi:NAD(P)-dependent dehydrogenase (short-subunit alcohol dehydrogenase family)